MTTEILTLIERSLWTAVALFPLTAAFGSLWLERRVISRRRKLVSSLMPARPVMTA